MAVWEISARLIAAYERKYLKTSFSKRQIIKLFWYVELIIIPVIILLTYFSAFHFKELLNCPDPEGQATNFFKETLNAMVLSWLIIGSQLLKTYYHYTNRIEREKAEMQKELLLSKYESLKNQVNPHFLFNSFSVLSSLIEENPQRASEFLNRLSKMFRYILDNKSQQMISLQKELEFLKSYTYLLKTRFEEAVEVHIDLDLKITHHQIPTLALQMLIENAVKHNRFSKTEPLHIHITNNDEYLVVWNKVNKKDAEVYSTKVGLENIRKRYSFQTNCGIKIAVDKGLFTVKLPLLNYSGLSA